MNLLVGILGASFISFFRCFVYRKNRKLSIWGRSKCEICLSQIKAIYLIPILGYLLSLGKCNKCQGKISISHLLFEFFAAFIFLVFWNISIAAILIAGLICYVVAEDAENLEVKMVWILVLGLLCLSFAIFNRVFFLVDYFINLTILLSLFGFLYWLYPGKLGLGDVFFSLAVSPLINPYTLSYYLFFSSSLALIYLFISEEKITNQSIKKIKIPFIPFLAFSLSIVLWLE